jgi:hypothetical protein
MQNEGVILKTYDFLLYMIPVLEKVPRSQKFLLSDEIQKKVMLILECFIEAHYTAKDLKKGLLRTANIELHKLRYQIRLLHDLKCINHERFGHISEKVIELGKMCGGWEKSLTAAK